MYESLSGIVWESYTFSQHYQIKSNQMYRYWPHYARNLTVGILSKVIAPIIKRWKKAVRFLWLSLFLQTTDLDNYFLLNAKISEFIESFLLKFFI